MWKREREQLIAEHRLPLILTIEWEGRNASLIYDAGLGRKPPSITRMYSMFGSPI